MKKTEAATSNVRLVDTLVAALRFKTPYETIEELWKSKPDILNMKPHQHMPGLNT